MTPSVLSTIAQMLYPQEQTLDFARIVTEVERVLTRLRPDPVTIDWTCDDLVTFALADTRMLLAWAEFGGTEPGRSTADRTADRADTRRLAEPRHMPDQRQTQPGLPRRAICLTIAIGPATTGPVRARDHAALCSQVVECIQSRFIPAAVLWREIPGRVEPEVVDALLASLPSLTLSPLTSLPPVHAILDDVMRTDRAKIASPQTPRPVTQWPTPQEIAAQPAAKPVVAAPRPAAPVEPTPLQIVPPSVAAVTVPAPKPPHLTAPAPDLMHVANDRPDLPYPPDAALARLRTALYPPKGVAEDCCAAPSVQMRLAAHCFNATLILVWVPLGAAMLTYTLLKGEDVRLSARLIAVTGTVLALIHSPLGHTVKAMAGVL